ncbi:MAG: hypothetical protein AB8G86_26915 [Saprospiraceae bacterium]
MKKLREKEITGSKRLGKWFVLRSDLMEYIHQGKAENKIEKVD